MFALLAALATVTKPLGGYMARVYTGRRTRLHSVLRPIERACYVAAGVRTSEQTWTAYAASVLAFGLTGVVTLYALLRLQPHPLSPHLAFNTAVSFVTNTSWQSYAGETTLNAWSQMLGIAVQSFVSCGVSMAVAVALFRGIATAQGAGTIGNFWVDFTRSVVYVLLPLSMAAAVALAGLGVIQNLASSARVVTLEGPAQAIAQGPVASQEAIKLLSSDGGGFFNASSAHPYENPTPLSSFLSMFLILVIPASMTYTFGRIVQDTRQGWTMFVAMALLLTVGFAAVNFAERGNWEGKDLRFGTAGAGLFAEVATASSSGAGNGALGSFTPLGVLVLLINMHTGEVVFGGPGSGMYSMLVLVLLTIFIAGLMVGRTPEYLGQKIEKYEVKMVTLAMLLTSAALLFLAATDVSRPAFDAVTQQGPRGFTESLYAFTSAVANNGSAMAGLNANNPWYDTLLALGMLAGRYLVILPVLAIAGSLARKKRYTMEGAMPTHGFVFGLLLCAVTLLVTGITYLPAFFLGPLAEYFQR